MLDKRFCLILMTASFMLWGNNPVMAVGDGAVSHSTNPRQLKNWFIRLKVEAPEYGLIDQSSRFGQLSKEQAEIQHSLKGLSPFSGDYLYVAFDNPQGLADNGEYKTSFHRKQGIKQLKDSWDFTVKTNDPLNDIILSWSGLYLLEPFTDEQGRVRYTGHRKLEHPLARQMKLIDRETLQEIPMVFNKQLQHYSFNMNGVKERYFTWVLDRRVRRSKEFKDYSVTASKEKADKLRLNARRAASKALINNIQQQAFDLGKPPEILDY